ncbi:mechanosensitive ion channel family protein [Candidatus Woesearchaeota archaeon]|nr:mechanosensitive ion channel family protein [Candidatus Woesearchaeota archaeon]
MDEVVESFNFDGVNPVVSIDLLSNITFALIIMLVGFAVGKLVGIALFKFFNGIELNKGLKKLFVFGFDFSRSFSSFVSWIIYVISVVLALLSLNILRELLLVVLFFVGFVFFGSFVFGLFFSLPNFFAGFIIKNKSFVKVNDFVVVNTVRGEVVSIGFFNTKIKGLKGETFLVPNKLILRKAKVVKTL